jgi:hypothetical protein
MAKRKNNSDFKIDVLQKRNGKSNTENCKKIARLSVLGFWNLFLTAAKKVKMILK